MHIFLKIKTHVDDVICLSIFQCVFLLVTWALVEVRGGSVVPIFISNDEKYKKTNKGIKILTWIMSFIKK